MLDEGEDECSSTFVPIPLCSPCESLPHGIGNKDEDDDVGEMNEIRVPLLLFTSFQTQLLVIFALSLSSFPNTFSISVILFILFVPIERLFRNQIFDINELNC